MAEWKQDILVIGNKKERPARAGLLLLDTRLLGTQAQLGHLFGAFLQSPKKPFLDPAINAVGDKGIGVGGKVILIRLGSAGIFQVLQAHVG